MIPDLCQQQPSHSKVGDNQSHRLRQQPDNYKRQTGRMYGINGYDAAMVALLSSKDMIPSKRTGQAFGQAPRAIKYGMNVSYARIIAQSI
jgi:hypothetical protein